MRLIHSFILTTSCLAAAISLTNTALVRGDELPKVLLIGDSIMQGYFSATQTQLAGKMAAYQPIPGSGQTRDALDLIDGWCVQEDWDVIHFNWGLHDVYTQSVGTPAGVPSVLIDEYEANLNILVPKLIATGAELVWCSTTPSYDSEPAFRESDILAYNAVAETIMNTHGIAINDLHDYAATLQPEYQQSPGNIHFSPQGSALLAEQVAAAILATGAWEEVPFTGLSHSGGIDPSSEGWISMVSDPVNVGIEPNDVGPGADAWRTTDTTTESSSAYYRGEQALTEEAVSDIANNGWSMKATLRVDDFTGSGFDETPGIAPGIQIALNDPRTWLLLALGSDANGDTTVQVKGGHNLGTVTNYTVPGSGYNDYELIWTPVDGLDVLVNDQLIVDNQACTTSYDNLGNRIYWGAMDTPGMGEGYWSSVEFDVLPEVEPPQFPGLYHSGGNDPATEGWTPVVDGTGTVGLVPDDAGPGADAWHTTDTAVTSSSSYYKGEAALDGQALADVATYGWSMRATLRVDDFTASGFDETPALAPGIQIAFEDPGIWLLLSLGSDSGDDTTMMLKGGYYDGVWTPTINHTIDGSGYNDYELIWDPTDGLDILVNGSLVVDNYDCATDAAWAAVLGNRIFWGAADTGGVGSGFWTDVAFEVNYPQPLAGDANEDGFVDVSDLGILATHYDTGSGKEWGDADFNGDGVVDVSDLGILATMYGTGPEAQSVP
ncbi:MAG: hypothetical protein U9N87_13040, partial [Planctomycetota bacterium]|nr:hypothetical protein [Planctomycetota bacterium]